MVVGLIALCIVQGYVWGSIPTGFWVGKMFRDIDIREHGSGSMGATNVLRTLGKGPALSVLVIDASKGSLAVGMAHWIMTLGVWHWGVTDLWVPWGIVAAGLAAVVGHSRPIWLKFKGGKSVATSLGILVTMTWPVAVCAFGVWLLMLGATQIVSFSSLAAAVAVPLLMLVFNQGLPYTLFGLVGGLYVLFTHRKNIERLLTGTEPTVGKKLANPDCESAVLSPDGEPGAPS